MRNRERRRHRSANTTRALGFQLSASLKSSELDGMFLTDDDGLCLAAAGDGHICDEVAAHVPMMGKKVESFDGVLFRHEVQHEIAMQRIAVAGSELYLCAVGKNAASRGKSLEHSAKGISRILMPVAA